MQEGKYPMQKGKYPMQKPCRKASFLMAEKNPNWWKRKIPTDGREKSQLMEEKNPNCDYLWKWKVSDAKGKVSDAEGKVSDEETVP